MLSHSLCECVCVCGWGYLGLGEMEGERKKNENMNWFLRFPFYEKRVWGRNIFKNKNLSLKLCFLRERKGCRGHQMGVVTQCFNILIEINYKHTSEVKINENSIGVTRKKEKKNFFQFFILIQLQFTNLQFSPNNQKVQRFKNPTLQYEWE